MGQGILADAAAKSPPELVVLIWYDFPNRDCAAAASMGEICCAYLPNGRCDWGNGGDCAEGINEYKTTYVDPFIEVLVEYRGRVPVVIVYEPDSLPNFATNLGVPNCAAVETRNAYSQGASYALTELAEKTDATIYVDAAHGGWLGWHNNMLKFMDELKGLTVPWNKIRGFSPTWLDTSPWVRWVLSSLTASQSPIGMATASTAKTAETPAAKILAISSANGIQETESRTMHRCCAGLPRGSWAWTHMSSSTRGAMESLVRALTRRTGATFATQEQAITLQQMCPIPLCWMLSST